MIFVQPASIEPSQVGLAATLPTLQEYASKERSPTKRLLNIAETPSRLISIPLLGIPPSWITTHRLFGGRRQVAVGVQLWVLVVASLSSIRFPGVRFAPVAGASVVTVAPWVAHARAARADGLGHASPPLWSGPPVSRSLQGTNLRTRRESAAVTLDARCAMTSGGRRRQNRHERNHMPHVDLARRIRRRA